MAKVLGLPRLLGVCTSTWLEVPTDVAMTIQVATWLTGEVQLPAYALHDSLGPEQLVPEQGNSALGTRRGTMIALVPESILA